MASRPMLKALCRYIAERGQETYGTYTDDEGEEQFVDPEGEMWVFEQIAHGVPVGRIAKSITLDEPYGTPSRRMMYMWRDADQSEGRAALWTEAMEAAADGLMEQSLEDAETIPAEQGHVSKAKHAYDVRKAIAARQHPQAWGKKDLGEQIADGMGSFGSAMLAALTDYGHRDAPGMRRLAEAEVELLEAEDGGEG